VDTDGRRRRSLSVRQSRRADNERIGADPRAPSDKHDRWHCERRSGGCKGGRWKTQDGRAKHSPAQPPLWPRNASSERIDPSDTPVVTAFILPIELVTHDQALAFILDRRRYTSIAIGHFMSVGGALSTRRFRRGTRHSQLLRSLSSGGKRWEGSELIMRRSGMLMRWSLCHG
jgi:hypothetical protein